MNKRKKQIFRIKISSKMYEVNNILLPISALRKACDQIVGKPVYYKGKVVGKVIGGIAESSSGSILLEIEVDEQKKEFKCNNPRKYSSLRRAQEEGSRWCS